MTFISWLLLASIIFFLMMFKNILNVFAKAYFSAMASMTRGQAIRISVNLTLSEPNISGY